MRLNQRRSQNQSYISNVYKMYLWKKWMLLPAIILTIQALLAFTNLLLWGGHPYYLLSARFLLEGLFYCLIVIVPWIFFLAQLRFYFLEWKRPMDPLFTKKVWIVSVILNLGVGLVIVSYALFILRMILENPILYSEGSFRGLSGLLELVSNEFNAFFGTGDPLKAILFFIAAIPFFALFMLLISIFVTLFRSIKALQLHTLAW